MDNQEEIEKLVDRLMTSDVLETPSADFTKKVVDKVIVTKGKRLEYKPLLPKWVLSVAAVLLIGFIGYGVNLYVSSGTSNLYFEDLNKIGTWSSDFFAKFHFSKTLTYSIVISGLLICFHLLILKKYFEKRLV